ncbi:MAG: hypothetical protein JO193_06895 [Candidatus Eremiobacteraeota bacterium]|nr:hypothetical protein [Candidatus Eremiobacteraeota bacterium]MBV9972259.1 hypothetical protein [Candidatus Eremiobacteraeota bacterium]
MNRPQVTSIIATLFALIISAGIATAQDSQPAGSPAPSTVNYAQMPLPQLCDQSTMTIERLEYIKNSGEADICKNHSIGAVFGFASYSWQHPNPTFCNAGTGLRTGLLGFMTGKSIGNVNLITAIGTLLAFTFAGCNNTSLPQPTAAPTLHGSDSALDFTKASQQPFSVSETGYAGQFNVTVTSSDITVNRATGTPKEAGAPVVFIVNAKSTARASAIKPYVIVTDEQGRALTVPVTLPK